MATPKLIYCAGGNKRLAQIAIDAGFLYGSQLPATVYHPIYFADQDWKKPNRHKYMTALARHKPHMATVLDWEQHEQLSNVLSWAEETAQFVKQVVIIPKVFSGINKLPSHVYGAEVILGYSVPTKYGGTPTPIWEFGDWPVHLLGGTPHKQMEMTYYLNVVSADGNAINKIATRFCKFWEHGRWVKLQIADGQKWGHDAPYEAFRRSCINVIEAWRKL